MTALDLALVYVILILLPPALIGIGVTFRAIRFVLDVGTRPRDDRPRDDR